MKFALFTSRTVVGEAPDIGQIDGESDDGQEKVDLFVPRLARLTFRRQSSRHRWLIQRRRLADDAERRAIAAALRALPVLIVKRFKSEGRANNANTTYPIQRSTRFLTLCIFFR